MLNTLQSPTTFVELSQIQAARFLLDEARAQRDEIKNAMDAAWKNYQLFCDEDPRWFDPNCPWETVEAFNRQRDQYLITAELAEQAYYVAQYQLDKATTNLLNLIKE